MVDRLLPEAREFCLRLKTLIERLGPKAFGISDLAVLYSGPSRELNIAALGVANNVERSVEYARLLNAITIDETHIGKLLKRYDLKDHFELIYGVDDPRIAAAVFEVWAFASREFIKSGFKHAATAVCGADPNRVFRAHELKVLLTEETAVETINGVALQHFKDIYAAQGGGDKGFYAAFVEICRTELDVARERARTAKPEERAPAEEDYNARKLFFELEQAATAKATAIAAYKSGLATMTTHKEALAGSDAPSRPATEPPRNIRFERRVWALILIMRTGRSAKTDRGMGELKNVFRCLQITPNFRLLLTPCLPENLRFAVRNPP